MRVDLDNLILTLGFLHGLDLLVRGLALRGVTRIAVENPYYAHPPIEQEPGLVLGYGRLPLPSVPGVVGALARALQRA